MKLKKIFDALLHFKKIIVKRSDTEKYYKSSEACKITGLTYKQLDYYDRTNFIRPSVHKAKGYGTKRAYSFNDLLKLKVIKKLLDAGISLQKLRKTKKYLELNEKNDDVGGSDCNGGCNSHSPMPRQGTKKIGTKVRCH